MDQDERKPDAMRAAVWTSVEAMGIPPSPIRDLLFDLADVFDSDPPSDLLALASGALRALTAAFEEHYKERSALEVQLETIRVTKELEEMTGVAMQPAEFTHSDFQLPPATPRELAEQLGYTDGGRAARAVLRRGFPDHEHSARWDLTPAHVNYVRAHLAPRTTAKERQ